MDRITLRSYREVSLEGATFDRYYRNPRTRQFQYEYALFEAVSNLFASVRCNSLGIGSLRMYFAELPQDMGEDETPRKGTQEDILAEVEGLVEREVAGNVSFPMMHNCMAEAHTILENDGTHTFVFSDGIYGFSVHMEVPRKGHPSKIEVRNRSNFRPVEDKIPAKDTGRENAAHSAA